MQEIRHMHKLFIATLLLYTALVAKAVSGTTPCDGIDRSLPQAADSMLDREIAKQLHVAKADLLQSFKSDKWSILYVETHESDEVFLFYAGNPLTRHFVLTWSGAAGIDEEDDTRAWVMKHAKGIPRRLAACFAWHVTKDRDM